ncbi:hypothetical protein KC726_03860 [Candidatus Woesebacteria bacterium]|nr:hypothetical protein [Candidatus Woesebacteria bacterium]
MLKKLTVGNILIGADVILVTATGFLFRFIPPEVPLYYSQPWGDKQLADNWQLLVLPVLMHIFVGINTLMKKRIFKTEAFASSILYIVNITTIVVFSLVYIKILFLIT